MRRPTGKPINKAEAQRNVDAFKGVVKGVKNYGKNVIGGAKIVGGALKKAAKWPMKQLEKEWRGEDEHIEEFRRKQKRRDLDLE